MSLGDGADRLPSLDSGLEASVFGFGPVFVGAGVFFLDVGETFGVSACVFADDSKGFGGGIEDVEVGEVGISR